LSSKYYFAVISATTTIWENRQPVSLTLDKLRRGIPDSWAEQRQLFLAE